MERAPGLSAEILQRMIEYFNEIRPQIPTFLTLILAAITPIYTGTHASLSRPSTAAKPKKKSRSKRHAPQADNRMEGLTPIDALLYPLLTGTMLTGLYYLIKWLQDPALLNKILNYYLTAFGMASIWQFVRDLLLVGTSFIFPTRYSYKSKIWTMDQARMRFVSIAHSEATNDDIHSSPLPGRLSRSPLPSKLSRLIWKFRKTQTQPHALIEAFAKGFGTTTVTINQSSVLAAIVAISAVLYYNLVDRPWWLTNLFGFSFCYSALQLLSPTTFWTGTLILTSLFFYDIYFVFYTPMMIEVATKLDIPVKLLIPKSPDSRQSDDKRALTLLGLGDIVLPGIMLGLALRFDLYMYYLRKQKHSKSNTGNGQDNVLNQSKKTSIVTKADYVIATGNWGERFWLDSEALKHEGGSFPKPYFTAGMIGYVFGMLVTETVMFVTKHGQPALLYLVPSVLGSLWTTAVARGELAHMWAYTEAEGTKAEEKGKPPDDDDRSADPSDTLLSKGENHSSTSNQPGGLDSNKPKDEILVKEKKPSISHTSREERELDEDNVNDRRLFYVSISLPEEPKTAAKSSDDNDKKD